MSESATSQRDPLSVQQLFVRHARSIRGFVVCLAPSPGDVDDIMQEVFLVVTRKAESFAPGSDFIAWACAIARYETLAFLRKRRAGAVTFSSTTAELLAEEYEPTHDLDERIDHVRACMANLSPSARDAIRARYADGLKPADIAAKLNVKPATIHVTLSKARAALRECVEARIASEAGRD